MAYSRVSIFGIFWSYSHDLLMDLFLLNFGLILAYIWTYFCLYMVIFLHCKILILLANWSYSRVVFNLVYLVPSSRMSEHFLGILSEALSIIARPPVPPSNFNFEAISIQLIF